MNRVKGLLVAALTVLLAACQSGAASSGSTEVVSSEPQNASAGFGGSAGLDDVSDPAAARDFATDAIRGKTIAYVPIVVDFEITTLWLNELQDTFDMMGAELIVSDPAFDIERMTQMIDSHINAGVDMLIIQNPDIGVLTPQIEKAQEEGIYVIVLNEVSNKSPDSYVGTDHISLGRDLAIRMVEDCDAAGKDKIAVLDGNGTDGTSILVNAGWDPVFEEAGVDIVSRQHSRYDPAVTNEIAATVLQQHPDLCGFAVNWDISAIGAGEAIAAAGMTGDVGVYNIDASATWCDALERGIVTVGAAYSASGIGVAAGTMAQHLFQLGDRPGSRHTVTYVPHKLVDQSNFRETNYACYGAS